MIELLIANWAWAVLFHLCTHELPMLLAVIYGVYCLFRKRPDHICCHLPERNKDPENTTYKRPPWLVELDAAQAEAQRRREADPDHKRVSYDLGLIDEKGDPIKDPPELPTAEELFQRSRELSTYLAPPTDGEYELDDAGEVRRVGDLPPPEDPPELSEFPPAMLHFRAGISDAEKADLMKDWDGAIAAAKEAAISVYRYCGSTGCYTKIHISDTYCAICFQERRDM